MLLVYLWVSHSFGGKLATISLGDAHAGAGVYAGGLGGASAGVGGGSQAGSIIAYTAIFGVEREPAVAAAIVSWLITFAAVSLAGVPLLIHEGLSLGELRRMAEHEDEIMDEEAASHGNAAAPRGESAE